MKNKWSILVILVLTISSIDHIFAAQQILDEIVAIVDNSVILKSDINNLIKFIKLNQNDLNQPQLDEVAIRHQIIDQFINNSIIQRYTQHEYAIANNSQLDQIHQKSISNIFKQYQKKLLDFKNNVYSNYLDMISKDLIFSEISHRISILPEEVDALAKQILTVQKSNEVEFNLTGILVKLPENINHSQVNQAEALTELIMKHLKDGADFKDMVDAYGSGLDAKNNGEMGWNKLEQLPTLFAERLQGAKKGDIIGPIRTGVGFHILKVTDIIGDENIRSNTEINVRHILLCPSKIMNDKKQAHTTMLNIFHQIQSGRITFEQAAKYISEDPVFSFKGSYMGWRSIYDFDPSIRDALLHLKKGQISRVISSSCEWHLIQLLDIRQLDKIDLAQREEAYHLLFNRKLIEEANNWLQEQRAYTYVQIIDNNLY